MPQEFINQIYLEKAKNDSNSRDLAKTLDVLSKTVFGNVNRFVFELIQNADDSSVEGQELDVQFQLLDNYIIFSHNGKHFTHDDVKGISGMGNRASGKDKSNEKTGYKGIGFKSVFGSSDYAHILSGSFSFRFDKNYSEFGSSNDFPWQVIPIWTAAPVDEVVGLCNPERVSTIIKIADRKLIEEEILRVLSDCQIILFLRKVTKISFLDGSRKILEISVNQGEGFRNLFKDGKLLSSWIIKDIDLEVDEVLSEKLKALSDTECPEKLKEAKVTKLTFAAQVKDSAIVPVERSVMYAYLPTKAQMGFPYLINGDFLTNAERTELMENIWNVFLFKEIALRQLEWFAELQQTVYQMDVLKLLNDKYPAYSTGQIQTAYNNALESAAGTISFLPKHGTTELLTIKAAAIDQSKFCEYFPPSVITHYLGMSPLDGVVDLRLNKQSIIASLGAKQFTFTTLLELIRARGLTTTLQITNLILYFYERTRDGKNPSWKNHIEETPFIIDRNGEYKTVKQIFLPSTTSERLGYNEFTELSYIHPDILNHLQQRLRVLEWLKELGVHEPSELEIMRKAIFPMISHNEINPSNILPVTRFVYSIANQKNITDDDYDKLRSLKVLTNNGLVKAEQSYFPKEFSPEKLLETILPNANFVDPVYIENAEETLMWKAFFKRIGVREGISIDLIEEKIERRKFEARYIEALPYLTWLEHNEFVPSIYHPYRYSGQHFIQGFTSIEFRSNLGDLNFSKFFWGRMIDNWDIFSNKCGNTVYYRLGGNNKVPSYVEYYVRNYPSIPSTDGVCYKSEEVFTPALKTVIGKYLPVADLSSSITVGQADFFNFKKQISVEECLYLLNVIILQPVNADTTKQLFAIYDQLISKPSSDIRSMRGEIDNWKETAQLLVVNNTFQAAANIYIYAVYNAPVPQGSNRFLKVPPRSNEEINALAEIFNIRVISHDILNFVSEGIREDVDLREALMARAKYIALIYAHKYAEDYEKILRQIEFAFTTTTFISAEKLNLIYQEGTDIIVNTKIDSWTGTPGEFYFTGTWNSPLILYSLSTGLCSLLKLEGIEREFNLLMQLSSSAITQWLTEQGYPVSNIMEADEIFDKISTSDEGSEVIENTYEGVDIPFNNVFVETIKVAEIDFSKVKAVASVTPMAANTVPQVYTKIEDEQVKVDIGRWSEEYVYNYLKENKETFTEIIWHNESGESFLPYDFSVIENGVSKCIEVKGTPSLNKEVIYLPASEWQQMFKHGSNYSIFRVFGAGTPHNRLERKDNMRAEIEQANLLNFPMEIILP